jgi:adenine-specific DNA-methyltransferase
MVFTVTLFRFAVMRHSGRLLICLSRVLTREALRAMIGLKPQSLLCLDERFAGNDTLKVNAQLECQSHGIQLRTA